MLLFFNSILANLPQAALAAVVISAALALADVAVVRRFARVRKSSLVLSLAAFGGVVFFGVLAGIVLAIALSILLFFHRSWWPNGEVLGRVERSQEWHSLSATPDAVEPDGVLVYRWEAPLFFANAGMFRQQIRHYVRRRRPQWVVLQCEAITDIDITAADMLERLDTELNAMGVHMAFVELRTRLHDVVYSYGLFQTLDRDHFYDSTRRSDGRHPARPRRHQTAAGDPIAMSDVDRRFRTSRRAQPPSRWTLTVAAVLVVANLVLFALIAEDLLDGGGLISHDEAVLAWFVEHRTDALISAAKVVSTIGSFVSLSIFGALLGLWLWRRGWHVALAVAPAASLVLASLASTASKALFDRERPPVVLHATTVTLAAFPSGHATDAAAFFLAASLTLAITIAHHRSTRALLVATGLFLAHARRSQPARARRPLALRRRRRLGAGQCDRHRHRRHALVPQHPPPGRSGRARPVAAAGNGRARSGRDVGAGHAPRARSPRRSSPRRPTRR